MMFWNGSWGWGAWLAMALLMLAIWAVVIAGGIAFTRSSWNTPSTQQLPEDRMPEPAHRA
ncbi:hypothetical protein acdb102_28610 [Acidothermaceae bacterium B102]|nr:hypothetical protein acdb102_28610 [Acidothermaceae bacterium B102]